MAANQYGYSKEEFGNMTLEDIRPHEDIPILTTAIEHLYKRAGTYKEGFFRHRKKDGSIFPVLLKSNLISYQGHEAELVTAMDISKTLEYEKKQLYQMRLFQCISDVNTNLIRTPNWLNALDACFTIITETLKIHRIYFLQSDVRDESINLRLYRTRNIEEGEFLGIEERCLPFPLMQMLLEPMRNGRKFQKTLTELTFNRKDIFDSRQVKSLLAMPIIVNNNFRGFIGLEDCKREKKWTKEELQVMHVLTSNLSHLINQSDAMEKIRISEGKFKSLVQNGKDLISIIDLTGKYVYASPTHKSQLGYPQESLLGTSYMDKIFALDVLNLEEAFKKILKEDQVFVPPYRYRDSCGNWKWLETVLTNRVSDTNINGIVVNTSDITDKMQLKIKKELVLSMTKSLGTKGNLKDFLYHAVEEITKATNCKVGEVWLISRDETRLNLNSRFYSSNTGNLLVEQERTIDYFEIGQGLPGKVWASKKNLVWKNIAERAGFERAKKAGESGLQTAIGIPIFNVNEFIGCFSLLFDAPTTELTDIIALLNDIGYDIGGIVKQRIIEEEYREFFELSPDPFCIIGFDGKIKHLNEACARAIGLTAKQLLGQRYETFIHESDREILYKKIAKGITSNIDVGNEIRMTTANNEEKWLVWSCTFNMDDKLVFAVAKDITEQKWAENAMRIANGRLRQAQNLAKLGYWYRDFNSELSEWSQETYDIYGYSPENFEPTIKNVSQTFHPEDRYLIENNPKDHIEPDKVTSFEHRIITAQGEIRWVHQEIQMILRKDGTPSHLEGVIQDITERKENEQQLKLSNQRFLLAMLASNQVIWELDHNSRMLIYSHIVDGDREQIIKEPFELENSWFESIHAEDREAVWNTLTQDLVKIENSDHGSIQYRVVEPDGSMRHVVDKFYTQRDVNGCPVVTIGSVTDITASMDQMEKITLQNKVLSDIAWLQSHAIRSPLTRIMALLNHFKSKKNTTISLEDLLHIISTSVHEIDSELHKIIEITENR